MISFEQAHEKVFSRNPPSVNSKVEFYALYETGFFGNKAITWKNLSEVIESGWKGKICIRGRKGVPRSFVKYNVAVEEAKKIIEEFKSNGIKQSDLTFNQLMPDDKLILQGEVTIGFNGIDLHYTTIKKPMNIALKEESINISGLRARILLENTMCSESFESIIELLYMFPGNVIEFSVYSIGVGIIDNRNTIIWEVRNY